MNPATNLPLRSRARRFWDFWCEVLTDDPVRRALNRTLAQILAVLIVLALIQAVIGAIANQPGTSALLIALPVMLSIWWLNRRGTASGAIIFSAFLLIIIVLTYKPETFFIDKYSVIHAGFLIPIITTIFFVRPRAGIIAIIGTIAALSINCVAAGFGDRLLPFITLSILNLGSAGAIMMYVAGILIRHIKDLDALNNELEQRVTDRTAQLAEANAFIERRATERAKQVAAVVHDLRHTAVAADSVLSLLELDIEDAEGIINEIAANTDHTGENTPTARLIEACHALIAQTSKSELGLYIYIDPQKHTDQLARDTAYQWQHAYNLLLVNGWEPRKAGSSRGYEAEHPIHGTTTFWSTMPLVWLHAEWIMLEAAEPVEEE